VEHYIRVSIRWGEPIWRLEFLSLYMVGNYVELQFAPLVSNKSLIFYVCFNNSRQGISIVDVYLEPFIEEL